MKDILITDIFQPNNVEKFPPHHFVKSGAAMLPKGVEIFPIFFRHRDTSKIVFERSYTNRRWYIRETEIYRLSKEMADNITRSESFLPEDEPLADELKGSNLDYLIAKLPEDISNKLAAATYIGFVFFIGNLVEYKR